MRERKFIFRFRDNRITSFSKERKTKKDDDDEEEEEEEEIIRIRKKMDRVIFQYP